jgi:hypothetical protein
MVHVPDCSQGMVMNAHRSLYSVLVINQPKKFITISIRLTRYVLEECSTRNVPDHEKPGSRCRLSRAHN